MCPLVLVYIQVIMILVERMALIMETSETNELLVQKIARQALVVIGLGAIFLLAPCLGLYYITKGIFSITLAIQANRITVGILLAALFSCGIGLILFFVQWKLLNAIYAKYTFSQDGVVAKYLGRPQITIPWDEFQEVCICYADYNSRSDGQLTKVICLVKKGEKKNLLGRWKVDNFLHCKSVIRINYSENVYSEVITVCPYRVINYCDMKD